MEAGTAPHAGARGRRRSPTCCPRRQSCIADRVAVRHKAGDEWHDVTFAQVGEIVSEIGRGLIDLGIQPGDRVSLLCNTRPEWTYADFAISTTGAVVVPIYPTNSPEECEWVAGNSESVAIVCEDAVAGREDRRGPRQPPRTCATSSSSTRGRAGRRAAPSRSTTCASAAAAATRAELTARTDAVGPDDPYTFIYTSGTTGPAEGLRPHRTATTARCSTWSSERDLLQDEDDLVYLFLPLAHAFALLIQLASFDVGAPIAYFGGDTKQIIPELSAGQADLPAVGAADLREALHAGHRARRPGADREGDARSACKVPRPRRSPGQPVPPELQEHYDQADEQLFKNVRAAFGGRLREAVTGAAPIAKEILEFFWACGVPVLEGYGMTETSTVATTSTPEEHKFGTVGKALPGVEIKIAEDGEILIKGANIFDGYYKNDDASFGAVEDGWLHTGDLGSLDDDGYLSITGRKKDIIITAGGKNLTPANLENDLQADAAGSRRRHARRPPAVPRRARHARRGGDRALGRGAGPADRRRRARRASRRCASSSRPSSTRPTRSYAQVEQVKKFVILDHDLSQETGELTPSLKVKRNVVNEKYADLLRRAVQRLDRPRAAHATLGGACAPTRPTPAASSSGAGRARRPVRYRDAARARARPAGGAADGLAGARPARRDGPRQPAVLGPDPDRRGCGSPRRCSTSPTTSASGCWPASSPCWPCCFGGLVVLKRARPGLDPRAPRRGHDQRAGVLRLVFGVTALVGATLFAIWLLFVGGLGPSISPDRPDGAARPLPPVRGADRGGGQRRAARARPSERRRTALARVEPLDLSRTTWPELPPPTSSTRSPTPRGAGLHRYLDRARRRAARRAGRAPRRRARAPRGRRRRRAAAERGGAGAARARATSWSRRGRPTRCIRVMARRAHGHAVPVAGLRRRAGAGRRQRAHARSSRCATPTTRRASC